MSDETQDPGEGGGFQGFPQDDGESTPASMTDLKRMIRSKKRRHEEHSAHGLNIYPMMDMMTILLVFMVMQLASSSAVAVQQSEELRIPFSTSSVDMEDAVEVQISRSGIVVDGQLVVELRNGLVDPSQKQGGANGFLITRMNREMNRIRDLRKLIAASNPRRPFTGTVSIVADKRTPYRTLTEVIYTLGQSEFNNLRFVVNRQTAAPAAQ